MRGTTGVSGTAEAMKIVKTKLRGVLILEPTVFRDDRGFFLETYHRQRYEEFLGGDVEFVQDNRSRSHKNVLRGLHFQRNHPQGKLVWVVTGHVWDVVADVNPQSPTFKQWVGVDLTADNLLQLYVPPGYAHGFCVVSDAADFVYKCTDFYRPNEEQGIIWNDPDLAIEWPVSAPILSPRDASNATLHDCLRNG
jgi:dTDP-4-dehydrorhamnose 3,5-epimerase